MTIVLLKLSSSRSALAAQLHTFKPAYQINICKCHKVDFRTVRVLQQSDFTSNLSTLVTRLVSNR